MHERSTSSPILIELARLGLDVSTSPVGGLVTGDAESAAAFVARLRAMEVGVTWRDVFPDLPAHWDVEDPETWTMPYRPIGAFDYPTLPTGPALHVSWPKSIDDACLDRLVAGARAHGFRVYGAGFLTISNPDWPTRNAHVILCHDTTPDELDACWGWIDAESEATTRGISRTGEETYAP